MLGAGCGLSSGGLRIEQSWTRPAQIQAFDGRELCVELAGRPGRRPQRLSLEIRLLDAEGEPVRSAMPELADAQGRLVLRRQLGLERGAEVPATVCTFVPLEALPEPAAAYGAELLLRDAEGRVLGTQHAALALGPGEVDGPEPDARQHARPGLSSEAGTPAAPGWRNR